MAKSKSKYAQMSDTVQSAVESLHNRDGFECKDLLGKGTYGSVIKVNSQQRGEIAAKIVKTKVVNILEIREWTRLSHPNVLRLLDTIFTIEGVVVFLTDLMATNLFARLQSRDFRRSVGAVPTCRRYARQVLQGLNYLHRLGLCHLDLRAENVFLGHDDRAVVADFSGMCKASDMKKFCPLPHSLRPPEMLGVKRRVEPTPIDLWACGLLLANLFLGKGFYICTVKHPQAGTVQAVLEYKELFACEEYVDKFQRQTYPNSSWSAAWKLELIRLVDLFLQTEPLARMGTEEALTSTLFAIGEEDEMVLPVVCQRVTEVKAKVSERLHTKIESEKVKKRPKWRSGLDRFISAFNLLQISQPPPIEHTKKKKSKKGKSDRI